MNTGRIMMGTLLAWLISSSTPVLAVDSGQSGTSMSAHQHASDEAMFTRIGDWFATLGKSGFEKESILVQRRTARVARAIEHHAKHAEQGLREAGEGLQKGLDSMTSQ